MAITRHVHWLLMGALLAGCGETQGFTPYQPPAAASPFLDVPFLQEQNHSTNELKPGIGALISVTLPPPGLDGFEVPTQVTPRGLVTHDAQQNLQLITIPDGAPDLIAAVFTPDALVLAGPQTLYLFTGPAAPAELAAPSGVKLLGLSPGNDRVYLLTDQGLGWVGLGGLVHWPETGGAAATAALERGGVLLIGGDGSLRAYSMPAGETLGPVLWMLDASSGQTAGRVVGLIADVNMPQVLDLVVVGAAGLQGLDLSGAAPAPVDVSEFAINRVPLDQPTAAGRAFNGGVLVATHSGALRAVDRGIGPEWRVYNNERWLPDGEVRAVAIDPDLPDGPIYFATVGGLATVTTRRLNLEEKLSAFVDRIVERHDRDGAVADSHLTRRGDLSSNIPYDSDNDGSWTSYWLLAECFRYRVTHDPAAKAHVDRSLERMLSLQTLTGTDYFLARSVIRKAGCQLDDCDNPDDGEWFTSPDGEWWVKGDTSNDEVSAHIFMMGHLYDLCADGDQRARIRTHIDRIIGGIIEHGYQLWDIDGQVTTYGQFDPTYVNDSLAGMYGDGGRRSATMLAGLVLAHYLTGNERYRTAEQTLIIDYHYDQNVINEASYPGRFGNADEDEMAANAFFVLLRYEQDPALRRRWLKGWSNTYAHLRLEQAALFDLINAVVGGDGVDLENAGRWLQLAPVDFIRWDQHNSQRLDLIPPPGYFHDTGRMRSDGRILPYDERRNDRWNTDQFQVDGGMGGWTEMDGADVLMPYWMGRFYGFIVKK